MKKLLFSLMLILALSSCKKEEVQCWKISCAQTSTQLSEARLLVNFELKKDWTYELFEYELRSGDIAVVEFRSDENVEHALAQVAVHRCDGSESKSLCDMDSSVGQLKTCIFKTP